jgi:hypothetical protein
MSPRTLISRKFRCKLSDLQMLVLMELGEGGLVTFGELMVLIGASQSGIWNALHHSQVVDFWEITRIAEKDYYGLSDLGRMELKKILI